MIEALYRIPPRVPAPRTPRPLTSVEKGSCISQSAEKPDLDAQAAGIELCWTTDFTMSVNDDLTIAIDGRYSGQQPPFQPKGDYYAVETGQNIVLPSGFNALVLPHPRFFDAVPPGAFSDSPAVVPRAFACDLWPRPLLLLITRPKPGTQHIFYAGEPFCQVIPIPRGEVSIHCMSDFDAQITKDRDEFVAARDKQLGGYAGFLIQVRRLGWAGLVEAFPLTDKEAGR